MRALVAALVVVACSAPTAKPRTAAPAARSAPITTPALQQARIARSNPSIKSRPRIEMASVAAASNHHRPWPLAELPSLQPHHDFAMARDLCSGAWAERNKRRPDLVAYGDAWCKLRTGDDGALGLLAKLADRSGSDVARAARLDVINHVARQDASRALARLREVRLDDATDLDLLAATFGALGQREEASVVAAYSSRVDHVVTPIERCERVLAWSALDEDAVRELQELPDDFAAPCAKRAEATLCAIARASTTHVAGSIAVMRECFNEFPDDTDVDRRVWLLSAFYRWSPGMADEWVALARDAAKAMPLPGAEELALTALDNALVTSCDVQVVHEVRALTQRIAEHDLHHPRADFQVQSVRARIEYCETVVSP